MGFEVINITIMSIKSILNCPFDNIILYTFPHYVQLIVR